MKVSSNFVFILLQNDSCQIFLLVHTDTKNLLGGAGDRLRKNDYQANY